MLISSDACIADHIISVISHPLTNDHVEGEIGLEGSQSGTAMMFK